MNSMKVLLRSQLMGSGGISIHQEKLSFILNLIVQVLLKAASLQ